MDISLFGIGLLTMASAVGGGIVFYWRASDRRLTDIPNRQEWFKTNYEGDQVHGDHIRATVASVRCYPPRSTSNRLKRYLLSDKGRTEVTIMFQTIEIEDYIWDELKDLVESGDTTVTDYGYNPQSRSSFVRVECQTFDSEKIEQSMSDIVLLIDTFVGEVVLNH